MVAIQLLSIPLGIMVLTTWAMIGYGLYKGAVNFFT